MSDATKVVKNNDYLEKESNASNQLRKIDTRIGDLTKQEEASVHPDE